MLGVLKLNVRDQRRLSGSKKPTYRSLFSYQFEGEACDALRNSDFLSNLSEKLSHGSICTVCFIDVSSLLNGLNYQGVGSTSPVFFSFFSFSVSYIFLS